MPDLSRCKNIDGKLYCWDKADKRFVEVTMTPLDFTQCPENVLAAFLEDGDNEAEDQCRKA